MSTIDKLIAENPIFGGLSADQRSGLISQAVQRRYQNGEVVCLAGEIWPYFFMIEKGSVGAHKQSAEGRLLIVTSFSAGDVFWGLAFFQEQMPQPVTLVAEKAVHLFRWSSSVLQPFFQQYPLMSWELARLMILKMKVANEILEGIAFQPVAGRLETLLLEVGSSDPDQAITRSLTLDEMAARVGSTREMICRFLHRFADDGIIEITRTEYRITNPAQLMAVSKYSKG